MLGRRSPGSRSLIYISAIIAFLFFVTIHMRSSTKSPGPVPPLVQQYIQTEGHVSGGRFYIPPAWLSATPETHSVRQPKTILQVAELALELALRNAKYIENSKIPLIVHQTWKSMDAATWRPDIQESVEDWLRRATNANEQGGGPQMAYLLWDDEGFEALFKTYEAGIYSQFDMLPYKVEKADAFRVAVLRWFGGVYADVDTQPLQHPNSWVQKSDLEPWTDVRDSLKTTLATNFPQSYEVPPNSPAAWKAATKDAHLTDIFGAGAILGIECDTRPESDDYWRMGYTYPVQLTNWALAMAPQHPIGAKFLTNLATQVKANETRLKWVDPLDLTGPPAITGVIKDYAKEIQPEVRWEGLTGLDDESGGRGKLIAGDVLILPITGFSPGRGWHNNMGSQSITHYNARVHHEAAGSWRHKDFKVEIGKICRTFLGGCRDWSKIPDPYR